MTVHREVSSGAPRWQEQVVATGYSPASRSGIRPSLSAKSFRAISAELAITPTVSVIIPALNEAKNLPHVFSTLPEWVNEVILVDGRSTDETVTIARRLWPGVKIVMQSGAGKGDALLAGFAACTSDIVVTMDADGSTDGAEIVRFVSALVAGADFAKGSRFACGGGSSDITAARRYGNRLLSRLVNVLFGTRYTDLCYGYNAFWTRHLTALALDCDGFEVEAMMNIRAAARGLCIHEVPSFERTRLHGASNLRIVMDGWRIVKVIAREWSCQRQAAGRNEQPSRTSAGNGSVVPPESSDAHGNRVDLAILNREVVPVDAQS